MQKQKVILQIVFGVLVASFFLWLTYRKNPDQTLELLLKTNVSLFVLGGFATIAGNIIRAWRWNVFLKHSGESPQLNLATSFSCVMNGYVINTMLPRGGEVARCVQAARLYQIPLSTVLGTLVLERLLDVLAVLMLFVWMFAHYAKTTIKVNNWLWGQVFEPALRGKGNAATVTAFLLLTLFFVLIAVVVKKKFVSTDSVKKAFKKFLLGFSMLSQPSAYMGVLFSSAALWLCYGLSYYLVFFSQDIGHHYSLGLSDAFAVMAIASLGMVVPTPASAGTFNFFCQKALVLMFGVNNIEAGAYAAVYFLCNLGFVWIGALFGFLSFYIQSGFHKNKTKTS